MTKKSYNRILTKYDSLFYTIKYFDAYGNFRVLEQCVNPMKGGTFRKFVKHIKFDVPQKTTPFEINASYTIRFYDRFAQPLPLETIRERVWAGLDNPENYVNGYPVVHTVNRDVTFWITNVESDILKIQNYLKKQNLPLENFLAIDRDFHGVFPSATKTVPLELWNFFNKKHRAR